MLSINYQNIYNNPNNAHLKRYNAVFKGHEKTDNNTNCDCVEVPLSNRQQYPEKKVHFGPLAYNMKSIARLNLDFSKPRAKETSLAELQATCDDNNFKQALQVKEYGIGVYDEDQQKDLYKRRLEDKKLITKLITAQSVNPFNETDIGPTFKYEDIAKIHDYTKESYINKKAVNETLKEMDSQTKSHRFHDAKSIISVCEASYIDKNLTKTFIDATMTAPAGFERPRFIGKDILQLVKLCHKSDRHKELCFKYMNENDGQGHPSYNAEAIENLTEASLIDEELTDRFRKIKKKSMWGGVQNKYDSDRVKQLVKIAQTQKELVEKYINCDDDSLDVAYAIEALNYDEALQNEFANMKGLGRKSDSHRFTKPHVFALVHMAKEYGADNVRKILNLKSDENNYRFDALEIKDVLEANKINPQLTEILLNAEETLANGSKQYKYCGDEIIGIVKLAQLDKNLPFKLMYEKVPSDIAGAAPVDRFTRNNIWSMSTNIEKYGKSILNYINETKNDGTPKYSGNQICALLGAEKKAPELTKYMYEKSIKTNSGKRIKLYSAETIARVVDGTESTKTDPAVVKKMMEMEIPVEYVEEFLSNARDRKKISKLFTNQHTIDFIKANQPENTVVANVTIPYIDGIYRATALNKSSETIIVDFKLDDKDNPQIIAREYTKDGACEKIVRREYPDNSRIVEVIKKGMEKDLQGYKKTYYNSDGIQTYSEVVTPSKKNGEYIINSYKRGPNTFIKKEVGSVKISGNGSNNTNVKISTISNSNIETKQNKEYTPEYYKNKYSITDTDGKSLFESKRTHKKIDTNHYVSTHNDDTYDIQIDNEHYKIDVTKFDKTGEMVDKCTVGSNVLDFKLLKLYRQLPGDFFFKMKKMGLEKVLLGGYAEENNANFASNYKTISLSDKYANNPFAFAHEFGHAMDRLYCNDLQNDKDLKKIFDKELAIYKKTSCDTEGRAIDYFTTRRHKNNDNCLSEVIAETNALVSGLPNNDDSLGIRTLLLQQHFPETIAYIANKLDA